MFSTWLNSTKPNSESLLSSIPDNTSMLVNELNSVESCRLLKVVDDMREMLHQEKVALPHIVVVGDQSVGKSSVLEAISGVQLPRAQNICTRCPLELRMKNIPLTEKEYATIRCNGVPEMKFHDFLEIRRKVEECTVKLAGTNYNVSSSPIYLTVYKKDIQEDLTLIDLPGITRNPVGEQSKTIYEDIVKLINHYIEPITAVVLHVIPASVDFTTSESIQISKKYDPHCERQLIAVSKIDKFDKGISDKLQGLGPGSMVLKLGCVAVLNRSQQEIDDDISFEEMRRREEEFFRSRNDFENVPEQYLGCKQLVKRLASIQQERIRSTLPSILDDLKKQIKAKKSELKEMPTPITSESDCWTMYIGLIKKYHDRVYAHVHGVYDSDMLGFIEGSTKLSTDSKHHITVSKKSDDSFDDRIGYQLHSRQKKCADQIHNSFTSFFTTNYRTIVLQLLQENAGVALPNFPSFSIIERLYRIEHKKFNEPCEELIENTFEYLKHVLIKMLNDVFSEEASYKHIMIHKLTDIILNIINENEELCSIDIRKMLDIEQRVFTLNQYYMDTVNKIKQEISGQAENKRTDNTAKHSSKFVINGLEIDLEGLSNEHQAAIDIQVAIAAYCHVVERRLIEQVAQLCYYWSITRCALILDSKLNSAFTSALLFEWMREPFDQQQKRENLKKSIDRMERALYAGQHA